MEGSGNGTDITLRNSRVFYVGKNCLNNSIFQCNSENTSICLMSLGVLGIMNNAHI